MDWKDGLTAAAVVGLGYLGIKRVTKGAESFAAEYKTQINELLDNLYDVAENYQHEPCDCTFEDGTDAEYTFHLDKCHLPYLENKYYDTIDKIWPILKRQGDIDPSIYEWLSHPLEDDGQDANLTVKAFVEQFPLDIQVTQDWTKSFSADTENKCLVCDEIIQYPREEGGEDIFFNKHLMDLHGENFIHKKNCWDIYTSLPSWEDHKQYWMEAESFSTKSGRIEGIEGLLLKYPMQFAVLMRGVPGNYSATCGGCDGYLGEHEKLWFDDENRLSHCPHCMTVFATNFLIAGYEDEELLEEKLRNRFPRHFKDAESFFAETSRFNEKLWRKEYTTEGDFVDLMEIKKGFGKGLVLLRNRNGIVDGPSYWDSSPPAVEWIEDIIANSDWELITADQLGALSEAPVLAKGHYDDEGNFVLNSNVAYYFGNYQIEDWGEVLDREGEVFFHRASFSKAAESFATGVWNPHNMPHEYLKLESIHSAVQELAQEYKIPDNDENLDLIYGFVEDLREPYFDENGDLKNAESFFADSISICGVCSVAGHQCDGQITGCPCCEMTAKRESQRPTCNDCGKLKSSTPQEYNRWTCWPCRDAAGGGYHGTECYCNSCMGVEYDEDYNAESFSADEITCLRRHCGGKLKPYSFCKECDATPMENCSCEVTHPKYEMNMVCNSCSKQYGAESFAADDWECKSCGATSLNFYEHFDKDGRKDTSLDGFFCANCELSPCGIYKTDSEPCTCDISEYGKYTFLGRKPHPRYPSQFEEDARIRILGKKSMAETHAYSYAYNEGHSDSRKRKEYRPNLTTARQESDFKKILKQKGD